MKKIIKNIFYVILILVGLISLGVLDVVGVIQHGMDYFFSELSSFSIMLTLYLASSNPV